jgi:hypothetical protein
VTPARPERNAPSWDETKRGLRQLAWGLVVVLAVAGALMAVGPRRTIVVAATPERTRSVLSETRELWPSPREAPALPSPPEYRAGGIWMAKRPSVLFFGDTVPQTPPADTGWSRRVAVRVRALAVPVTRAALMPTAIRFPQVVGQIDVPPSKLIAGAIIVSADGTWTLVDVRAVMQCSTVCFRALVGPSARTTPTAR